MHTSLIGFGMSRCSFCSKRLFAKATEVSVRLNMKLISVEFYQPFLPPNTRYQEHVQMRVEHNEARGQLSREVRKHSKRSTMLRKGRWRGGQEGGWEGGREEMKEGKEGGWEGRRKEGNIEGLLNHLELMGSFTLRIS